jgi:hypothetical protein
VNILITAAASLQAHQLKSKLITPSEKKNIASLRNVILGDHLELPAFMLSSGKMLRLPQPASVAYSHEMLTLCLDNSIQTVYVFREKEVKLLIEAEQLFKEFDINIVIIGNEV